MATAKQDTLTIPTPKSRILITMIIRGYCPSFEHTDWGHSLVIEDTKIDQHPSIPYIYIYQYNDTITMATSRVGDNFTIAISTEQDTITGHLQGRIPLYPPVEQITMVNWSSSRVGYYQYGHPLRQGTFTVANCRIGYYRYGHLQRKILWQSLRVGYDHYGYKEQDTITMRYYAISRV